VNNEDPCARPLCGQEITEKGGAWGEGTEPRALEPPNLHPRRRRRLSGWRAVPNPRLTENVRANSASIQLRYSGMSSSSW
jgi:hypothetical protein